MFLDDTDLFLFPALTAHYGNSASLHVGAGGTQAGFILGNDLKVGAFHNPTIVYNDLAQIASETNQTILQPGRLPSVYLGKKSGDSMFGFGINPAFSLRRTATPPNGAGISTVTQTLAFDVELLGGFSTRGESMQSDTALAVGFHRYQQNVVPTRIAEVPFVPSAALRHRTIWKSSETFGWGLFGEVARRDESFTQREPFTSEASLARYVLQVGTGAVYRPVPIVTVAPTLELDAVELTGSVDRARLGFARLTIPRFRVAAELMPNSWFVVRAGVLKSFILNFARPASGGQVDTDTSTFSWSTGLGVRLGGFELDATLSSAILTNGPQFIGGGAPGLFGGLSARYQFELGGS
jgi:hypothetical protein